MDVHRKDLLEMAALLAEYEAEFVSVLDQGGSANLKPETVADVKSAIARLGKLVEELTREARRAH